MDQIKIDGNDWQVVAALAVDHSGSRVLSGSYDYTVRMYDFQGMKRDVSSFRQLEPSEGHQVRALSWSPTAGFFLCVTGSAQAKVPFLSHVFLSANLIKNKCYFAVLTSMVSLFIGL